jgi:WD40 repeat protein
MQVVQQGWEQLAERRGGTVTALTAVPGADGQSVVFAATAVGIRRSLDGGQTWEAHDVGASAPFVTALAPSLDYANDQMLFIGTAEGCYRSTDGGRNWQMALTGGRIFALATVPGEQPSGTLFVGSELDGILRTDDAGRNWGNANPGLLDLTILALAFSPRFAADGTGFAATAAGLYRTRNGGKSWRQVELPIDDPAVQCLAISPDFATDKLIFAGTETDGLLRSENSGTTWDVVESLSGRSISAIIFSPDGSTIAAATNEGIAISADGGETWRTTGTDLGFVLSLAFVPEADGETIVAGLVRRGIARSTDGGATWAIADEGLNAIPTLALAVSPAFATDQTIFSAGLDDGITVSRDGGVTWASAMPEAGDSSAYGVAISPRYADDRTVFAALGTGLYRSRDGGESWSPIGEGSLPEAIGAIVTGPPIGGKPTLILAVTLGGKLFASEDDGESWRSLGEDFGGGAVVSLAVSPGYAKDDTLFVGTRQVYPDGSGNNLLVLWRSTDRGAKWHHWLQELGRSALPLAVPAGYLGDGALYVGLDGRVAKPIRNTWRRGGGERLPVWTGIDLLDSDGKPVAITALVSSPNYRQDNTVYAATSGGVYVSRDSGRSFEAWSGGMGGAPVVAIALTPRGEGGQWLYALGLGGNIWRREIE